ncbi:MAG TPA: Gfo/Idh/MocA family oxidoreductase [Polyangiaceae bacterium]|nr:Gfo/Idh/MocA family oxidoreductase [Polyangiaceae bacterium]
MRAVICGAGAAGFMHALSYRAAGVEIVGIFDPSRARALSLAEMCRAEVVPSETALFALRADFASICSPPIYHADQAERAAQFQRVIFVEKPVATTRADFDRVARLRAVPVLQWRAGRAIQAVRSALAAGDLGDAPTVTARLSWGRSAAYFAAGRASRTEWGCGVLLSVGIHAIDAVAFALGRPLAFASGSLGYREGVEVETSGEMITRVDGGARALFRATFEGASDRTILSFEGSSVRAVIRGSEGDPTASRVLWRTPDRAKRLALAAREAQCEGQLHPPLIVPFLVAAIAAVARGAAPGECEALPSAESTRGAHEAVFALYEAWRAPSSPITSAVASTSAASSASARP